MTAPRFIDLFGWEWRQIGRNPLLWAVLLTLAASFLWGAVNTAGLHGAQRQAQARTLLAETAHRASITARATAYRAPVTADAPEVPYWQDPTNVSGFSQYFIFQHAMKPHLPLASLAVGASDIAPSQLEVKLNTPFGFGDSYDFENPRGLALGRFDLGFALVYLLPIALILLFGLLVTFERDRGMLRLVAAQSTGPRLWLGARIAAILAWTVPAVLAALLLSLGVAGVSFAAALPELLAAVLLVVAYILLWTGIAALVLSRLSGAAGALGVLAAIWAALTIGLPLLGSILTSAIDPAPSAIAAVDAKRRVTDAIEAESHAILERSFAARPDLRAARDRIDAIDYATELTFLAPETEKRLAPTRKALVDHIGRQARLAGIAGYVAPPLGLEGALATLAGTDNERHRRFEAQARVHQLRLRGLLYPLVQREIVAPTPRPEPAARGRFSMVDQDILPAFAMVDEPAADRIHSILPFALWLAFLGVALTWAGLLRTRAWPRDL